MEDLLNRIDLEQPLWAVLDCAGGLKKAATDEEMMR
jgi:hypothetical protein